MKCDEVQPGPCGPCAKGDRNCVYGVAQIETAPSSENGATSTSSGVQIPTIPQQHSSRHSLGSSNLDTRPQDSHEWPTSPVTDDSVQITSPQSSYSNLSSRYGTDVAPLRWLGLLAGDASDVSLDLSPLETFNNNSVAQKYQYSHAGAGIHSLRTPGNAPTALTDGPAFHNPLKLMQISTIAPEPSSCEKGDADERKLWQAPEPVQLKDHEHDMFRRFVTGISLWIDLFDPLKHFSTFVPHLALNNEGLMKAILALGARHLSIKPNGEANVDRTAAVQYYSETLQYLQSAMRYTSYKNSLELLATVLVVSTYEMIDGASKGWERHLKGVFWIQRSRDINGESGGLEQAIWWAWLRQDVWAAFRERRRCFSFFKPTKLYQSMTMWDMASRVVYILAQAVNYGSEEEQRLGEPDLSSRITHANNLLNMLDEWRNSISIHFEALPVQSPSNRAFQPLWIHPPAFGASIQMYNMARILLLIQQPAAGGYIEYLRRDKIITQSIDVIGSIALTLTDDASRLMSTQCLFAAGLYCTDDAKRTCITELLREHSNHTGWPSNTDLAEELRTEWSKQKPG